MVTVIVLVLGSGCVEYSVEEVVAVAVALLLVATPPLEVEDRDPVAGSVLDMLSNGDVDVSVTGRQVYS